MKLTEAQKAQIRQVLLNQNTDCYFDTPRGLEEYLNDIVGIVENTNVVVVVPECADPGPDCVFHNGECD